MMENKTINNGWPQRKLYLPVSGNFTASIRQVKMYWPIVLILIMAIIVTFVIIYTKVPSPPLFVYYFGETNTLSYGSNNSFSPQIASSGKVTYIVKTESDRGSGDISIEKNYGIIRCLLLRSA